MLKFPVLSHPGMQNLCTLPFFYDYDKCTVNSKVRVLAFAVLGNCYANVVQVLGKYICLLVIEKPGKVACTLYRQANKICRIKTCHYRKLARL